MVIVKPSRGQVVAATVAAGMFVLLIAAARSPTERIVGLNTPIRYDDFAFSVTNVRRDTSASGKNAPTIVTLKVHNQARRVPFQFRRSMAVIVDDQGRSFRIDPQGQAALDAARGKPDPLAAPIPAGTSAQTDLVFKIPDDARRPRLNLNSGAMGRIEESIVGADRIALRPLEK